MFPAYEVHLAFPGESTTIRFPRLKFNQRLALDSLAGRPQAVGGMHYAAWATAGPEFSCRQDRLSRLPDV